MTTYPTAKLCAAETHVVENMPTPLENYNMFSSDPTLREAVRREGGDWAAGPLSDYGERCGSAEWILRGVEANRVRPVLETHDRYGNRIDEVTFHPAYHELMAARIATAVGKYWVCKRQPGHAYEAMECIGGSAVMENSPMPRLYREAPINTIWEGSGNVQCLDVLRILSREPEALEAFMTEVELARGMDSGFDRHIKEFQKEFTRTENMEYRARGVVEKMVLALQASLLLRNGPEHVAETFCSARLAGASGHTYGMLPEGVDCSALIDRGRV